MFGNYYDLVSCQPTCGQNVTLCDRTARTSARWAKPAGRARSWSKAISAATSLPAAQALCCPAPPRESIPGCCEPGCRAAQGRAWVAGCEGTTPRRVAGVRLSAVQGQETAGRRPAGEALDALPDPGEAWDEPAEGASLSDPPRLATGASSIAPRAPRVPRRAGSHEIRAALTLEARLVGAMATKASSRTIRTGLRLSIG